MRTTSARRRPRLAALVLAAGGSSRLGQPKQLLRLRGETLIVRACRLARGAVSDDVVVVLGAGALRLRCLLQRRRCDVTIVHNAGWRDGMASSLRAGLERVPRGAVGVLLLVVDQARIEAGDLERLVRHWQNRPGGAAAAFYSGVTGVPAIVPRRHFPALRSLAGDTGARHLLGRLGGVVRVPTPTAAFDIDTPQDVAALATAGSQ